MEAESPTRHSLVERPTTNGIAVLGLISLIPMTAYTLNDVTQRSLSYVWSASRRLLLGEPAKLAQKGLVAPIPAPDSRAENRWRVTPAGTDALRRWLASPVAPTRVNSEIALRILFADLGGVDDLRRSLDARLSQLHDDLVTGLGIVDGVLENGGPFPQRMHVSTAIALYKVNFGLAEHAALTWLREEAREWVDTLEPGHAARHAHFRPTLLTLRKRLRAAIASY